jgi:hypothetical protein
MSEIGGRRGAVGLIKFGVRESPGVGLFGMVWTRSESLPTRTVTMA